eukprot:TRINITY_DN93148_c0_g1_i1.p1 TRINITY_DN93148_c0_g1~~TRINITY_DN93148_c0_g1_i1.p1  ORF type:complete len:426 (-),score=38.35 TRINITY_DN93148_c0_g1_i1:66-1292(-)
MAAKHKWALCLVLFAVVADYVGVTMMRVAAPFYAKALGGSGTLTGGIETAYGVGQWLGAVTLPRLSDFWGRRRVLVFCSFCSAAGYTLAIISLTAASPTLLLLSRVPVGLAKQTVTISRAVVADCTEANEDRSRWMAFQCTALAIGCSLGPMLATQASERIGETAPVVIAASIFALLGPTIAASLPETSPKQSHSGNDATTRGCDEESLFRNTKVLILLSVLALPELGLVAHQSVTLNVYSVQHLGKEKSWIANVNSVSAIIQATGASTVCASLSNRGFSDVMQLQTGIFSYTLAALAIWWWQSPAAVIYSAPLAAYANSVLRTFPAALLSKQVPESRQGAAMGLLDVCSSVLRVLAPVLAGAFMDNFGGAAVFLAEAVLFAYAMVALLVFMHISVDRKEHAPKHKDE